MLDLEMKNNLDKPLPVVPTQQDSFRLTAILSVEARNHARRLILHSLEEHSLVIAKDDWNVEKESWASELLDSLDSLVETTATEGWLSGLRRSRTTDIMRYIANSSVAGPESHSEDDSSEDSAVFPDEETRKTMSSHQALQQIQQLLSSPVVTTSNPTAKHMLLTTDAFDAGVAPSKDLGFDVVPSGVGCVFTPNFYLLPLSEDDVPTQDALHGIVLHGLDQWDVDGAGPGCNSKQIIGGNFTFKGVTTPLQHASLCKILRLAIYVYLSLILEQHFLYDSHVKLNLPERRPRPTVAPAIVPNDIRTSPYPRPKRRESFPSGVWSFLSRKTENLLHRAAGLRLEVSRHSSLDVAQDPVEGASSFGEDPHQHSGTFSLLPDSISWSHNDKKEETDPSTSGPPFRATIGRIERSLSLLSTTAGMTFPLPFIVLSLAEKEDMDASRRLTGPERSGLNSVLGWEGRDARGRGMTGISGFARQQGICVLYSEHVPSRVARPASVASTSDSISMNSTISSAITTTDNSNLSFTRCGGVARWVCFRYYSPQKETDKSLGETIVQMCSVADSPCGVPQCRYKRGDHELRLIHGGTKVLVTVDPLRTSSNDDGIEMWERCRQCGEETVKSRMSDGTFLLSFGKYIELLIYSPSLHILYPPLCEHTSTSAQGNQASKASQSGLNIVRHFSYGTHQVMFSLSAIDVFDVHLPRLQLSKPCHDKQADTTTTRMTDQSNSDLNEPKRVLRKEIIDWWQGISEHMDRLEEVFVRHDNLKTVLKSLPRLPSSDDAFDDFNDPDIEITPKAVISGLPPPLEDSSSEFPFVTHLPNTSRQSLSNHVETSYDPTAPLPINHLGSTSPNVDNLRLLSNLRLDFQREEQKLYAQLSKTSATCLNDVRRRFVTSAKGALRRLCAWETKHLPKSALDTTSMSARDPAWWANDCHAVPGCNIIVREGDWGSIIAFTLSSQDYLNELLIMSHGKSQTVDSTSMADETPRPSLFSRQSSYRLFSTSKPTPDPDDNRVVWQEQEGYSAVISRKEHPRDPSTLLSLRDVLRKPPADSINALSSSRFAAQLSVRAQPAVEISPESVSGQLEAQEMKGAAGRILKDMDTVSTNSTIRDTLSSIMPLATACPTFESQVRRGASSVVSFTEQAEATLHLAENKISEEPRRASTPKDKLDPLTPENSINTNAPPHFFMPSSLMDTISHVMRYVTNTEEPRPVSSGLKTHHGLLSLDTSAIDERPHIKHDWTIGKRLRFSCTVYYAKQFDALRRRCNIDDVFLKSMERSDNWMAEGGKSKSNFWKTTDDRFIIKTLVNAWNVADLQVLIELAPSYFRYMDSTASKPTVLAKLLGFYTIEIRNLESGTTQAKADLLVMENLFYERKIAKTFDLKGIQGRKVKPTANLPDSKTLFDGEWIEGQQRALTLLHPHSKLVLQEAIRSDSEYLSKSNIMDYSLLLGIDIERKQIACGLVDTIGSYTFAKTLEYKAKQNLKSGKDVTVVPPNEYQERFVKAIDGYFLACPDKWSKPPHNTIIISDPNLLPSVL